MRGLKKYLLAVLLFVLGIGLCGCSAIHGQGEAVDEGHRRHMRQLRLEMQMLADDIDAMLLTDRPSRLTDMYIR
ncbi:MAG: hypothetical protein ABIG61_14535 [Planctomycetota bacterium]